MQTYRFKNALPGRRTGQIDWARIRASLTMREVAERYGVEVNAHGLARCPFHDDKRPSMKVYDGARGWWCFVCNDGGGAIDFVSRLLHISIRDAALRLDEDFALGACEERSDPAAAVLAAAQRAHRVQVLEDFRREYRAKAARARELTRMSKPADLDDGGAYGAALGELEALEYWFEQNPWR